VRPTIQLLSLLCCMLVVAGCSSSADISAAEREVEEFRKLMAAQQYAAIYAASTQDLKQAATEEDIGKLLDAVNRKLGKLASVEKSGWHVNVNTSGTFVTLGYKSKYERGDATEQFVYRLENGKASLVSYNINSMALVTN